MPTPVENTFHVAFYVGPGAAFDRLVRLATRSPYSHVELLFGDNHWISSSPRDGGVRVKCFRPKPGHWEFVGPFKTTGLVRRRLDTIPEGARYDWLGALGAWSDWAWLDSKSRWFCSELCGWLLGLPRRTAATMTPAELHEWLRRHGQEELTWAV